MDGTFVTNYQDVFCQNKGYNIATLFSISHWLRPLMDLGFVNDMVRSINLESWNSDC